MNEIKIFTKYVANYVKLDPAEQRKYGGLADYYYRNHRILSARTIGVSPNPNPNLDPHPNTAPYPLFEPKIRNRTNPIGLENMAAICYMNSILQMLY